MKRISTIFFQIIIILVGISALAFMLYEPHLEGRNVGATNFDIYFKDPFLACAYVASVFFFITLYKVFKILGYVRENKRVSQETVKALKVIQYCAMIIIGFVIVREVYIGIVVRGTDDIAGGVAMGVFIALISGIVVITTVMLQKSLQHKLQK